jgi:carboxypeptidase C (cathepsin A)
MTPSRMSSIAFAVLALAFVLNPASAQAPHPGQQHPQNTPAKDAPQTAKDSAAATLPADSASQHTAQIGSERIGYTATAGSLPLYGGKSEVTAKLFYVAYTRDGAPGPRPLTFVFNGGPGAAAAFLHLGAIGPRVVNFTDNGAAAEQPLHLADNPDSWLAFTDLVFVDPVGTGYSRATAEGEDGEKAFYSVQKDADAMADFIQLYLTHADRGLGPVFLAGESYGGFRAVLLANRLLKAGVQVRGAVLISPALEFALLRGDEYTLLPLALALPSIAASNLELKDGGEAALDMLSEVESFARTGYLLHLAAGVREDDSVNALLEQYTGLNRELIARHHGRISASLFLRDYRQRKDLALSRYDGSIGAPLPRPGDNDHFDPVLDRSVTVLAPAMTEYVHQELGFRTDLEYRLLNREISGKWDYGTTPNRQGFVDALGELQEARTHNPALKIMIANGYTDLVTPYGVSQFLVDQLQPIAGAAPIDLRVYRGGHMMYFRPASRHQLAEDARSLYRAAEPASN